MAIFWSPTTKGFYDDANHADMPGDRRQVSDDAYASLMLGQAEGRVIESDSLGMPVLKDAPAPSREKLELAARAERDRLLREVYDPGITATQRKIRMANGESVELEMLIQTLDAYAVALQNIPEQEGFPDNIIWPEPPTL